MAIPKSKRSGGPKTSSGRLNASKNALKTGAYSSMIVLPGESEEDFEKLHEQFMNDFIPSDVAESAMVYELAGLTWKKLRIEKLEHAAFIRSINLNITIKDMASEGIEIDKYHEKYLKELSLKKFLFQDFVFFTDQKFHQYYLFCLNLRKFKIFLAILTQRKNLWAKYPLELDAVIKED